MHACFCHIWFSFVLRCDSCLPLLWALVRYRLRASSSLSIFWVRLLNKKASRVEVNISLAFLYWGGIDLHPWPFVSDIAIVVLKRDVKLQLTCPLIPCIVKTKLNQNGFVVDCCITIDNKSVLREFELKHASSRVRTMRKVKPLQIIFLYF